MLSLQKLYSTGKPDGSPFSKTVSENHCDDPLAANDYTADLASGDYDLQCSPDGGTTWAKDSVKVTVK